MNMFSFCLRFFVTSITNLDLMAEYGADAWKLSNSVLATMFESAQRQHAELKKQIQETNWQRKREQTKAGAELKVGLLARAFCRPKAKPQEVH